MNHVAVENAKNFPRGSRVAPFDAETAEVLANRKYFKPGVGMVVNPNIPLPIAGEVTGYAGEYVLVRWDGHQASSDFAVHPVNLRAL